MRCKVYKKEFDEWNNDKKILAFCDNKKVYPKTRHIYYIKLGVNIGFESDGKIRFLRPVLVLAKLGSLFWVVPLTSKRKEGVFYHKITSVSFKGKRSSFIMLTQSRVVDRLRFQNEIGIMKKEEYFEIQKKMMKLYFPSI